MPAVTGIPILLHRRAERNRSPSDAEIRGFTQRRSILRIKTHYLAFITPGTQETDAQVHNYYPVKAAFRLPTAISTRDSHLCLRGNLKVLVKAQQGRGGTGLQTAGSPDFKITPTKLHSETRKISTRIKAHSSLWKSLAFATYYTQHQKYSFKISSLALYSQRHAQRSSVLRTSTLKGDLLSPATQLALEQPNFHSSFWPFPHRTRNQRLTNRPGSFASSLGSITQRNSRNSNTQIKENRPSKTNPCAVTPCI